MRGGSLHASGRQWVRGSAACGRRRGAVVRAKPTPPAAVIRKKARPTESRSGLCGVIRADGRGGCNWLGRRTDFQSVRVPARGLRNDRPPDNGDEPPRDARHPGGTAHRGLPPTRLTLEESSLWRKETGRRRCRRPWGWRIGDGTDAAGRSPRRADYFDATDRAGPSTSAEERVGRQPATRTTAGAAVATSPPVLSGAFRVSRCVGSDGVGGDFGCGYDWNLNEPLPPSFSFDVRGGAAELLVFGVLLARRSGTGVGPSAVVAGVGRAAVAVLPPSGSTNA